MIDEESFFFDLADIADMVLNGQTNVEARDSSSRISSPTPMATGGGLSTMSRKSGMN